MKNQTIVYKVPSHRNIDRAEILSDYISVCNYPAIVHNSAAFAYSIPCGKHIFLLLTTSLYYCKTFPSFQYLSYQFILFYFILIILLHLPEFNIQPPRLGCFLFLLLIFTSPVYTHLLYKYNTGYILP